MAISETLYFSLSWLLRLRWGLILGELAVLLLATLWLGISLPLLPIGIALAVQGLSNAVLYIQEQRGASLPRWTTFGVFLLDQTVLTVLLYCSGGHTNPFASMYILQIVFAAFLLSGKSTSLLLGLALVSYGALFFWNIHVHELASHHHDGGETFNLHLNGMFVAFALLASLLAYFTYRLKAVLEKQIDENKKLEQKARDGQKLLALTTLAAGAAHELATPLGSMRVAVHEMKQALQDLSELPAEIIEDAELISKEIHRCQSILAQMSRQAGEHVGEEKQKIGLSELFQGILKMSNSHAQITCETKTREHPERESYIFSHREALLASLCSLVKNAIDAGAQHIHCHYEASKHLHIFTIVDDGKGMPSHVLQRIGEPFFTTKAEGSGMGLGVYLAKSFVLRNKGELHFESREGKGTQVRLTIEREELNAAQEPYERAA